MTKIYQINRLMQDFYVAGALHPLPEGRGLTEHMINSSKNYSTILSYMSRAATNLSSNLKNTDIANAPQIIVSAGQHVTRGLLVFFTVSTAAGLHYRALVGHMVYSFVHVGAVVNMRIDDYYQNGKRWWIRLHEKGGIPRGAGASQR